MPEIHIIAPTVNAEICTMRMAAYCRVSSDSEDQLNSYANQVQHYTKLIGDNSAWQLVDIYADEALTGTRADTRPEFQRLLRDCRKGKIDKVFVKSISRFSRNMKDSLTSIRELKQLGVEVFFEKEQLDTGSFTSEMLLSFYGTLAQEESVSISGNMRISYRNRMDTLLSAFAQAESESISENVKWGKRNGYKNGKIPFQYGRLLGYEKGEDGRPKIVEDQAATVRRIYAMFLAGYSIARIKSELEAKGVPLPRPPRR
jgi:DNA invertase Pin-like site-specific DNA recombinase